MLQQFLACWKTLDPVGAKNRGLLSLLRRHRRNLKADQRRRVRDYFAHNPAIEAVWRVKETLSWILLRKHRTKRQCARLVPRFLRILEQLRACPFAPLATLGDSLHNWAEQIVPMWRFTATMALPRAFTPASRSSRDRPTASAICQLPHACQSYVLACSPALLTQPQSPSIAAPCRAQA